MRRSRVVDASLRPDRPAIVAPGPWFDDVVLALTSNVNLLLCGDEQTVASMLAWLEPMLTPPLTTWTPGSPLVLPVTFPGGTLLVREIAALSPDDQARLDEWSGRPWPPARIVSTSTRLLLPLVESGAFPERLYYRINTVSAFAAAP